jgi:hypothetical protein
MKNSSGFLVAYKPVLQIGKQENKRFSPSNLKAAYSIAEKKQRPELTQLDQLKLLVQGPEKQCNLQTSSNQIDILLKSLEL